MSSASLLVWHGSRDRRPHLAISQLTALVARELQAIAPVSTGGNTLVLSRPPLVDSAALELSPLPLHENILRFAKQAKSRGWQRVKICPLFLLEGVHAREDIPAEVVAARSQLGGEIELELLPHLGSNWQTIELLATAFSKLPPRGRILLAHGSRRNSAQQKIAEIAFKLKALPAYWHVPPDLEAQIAHLVTNEQKNIAIQPYFLFTGGITDAIAREVRRLQAKFIDANLYLGQPLGATPELATLIRDWIDS
ncbi:MAG: sirohydrochlorin chelatase [Cyanobacteria bacterium SBLK]|nr:sirohydrochlorin chelatase [Cyanobacteria bacterium SBLK]